jgi:hypothetical protein
MAEPTRLPHSDPERPLREATAYLHGELTAAEKAAFEAHLPGCADCQDSLRVGGLVFPRFYALLAADRRPRSDDDLLALLDAAQGEVDAEKRAPVASPAPVRAPIARPRPERRRWAPVLPWLVGGFAIAAALLVLVRPQGTLEPELLGGKAEVVLGAPHQGGYGPAVHNELALDTTLSGGKLELRAPREADDRYVAVALVDAGLNIWIVRRGDARDLRCLFGCGPLVFDVDVSRLQPGKIKVFVQVGSTPISEPVFEKWVTALGKHEPKEEPRALGVREVAW